MKIKCTSLAFSILVSFLITISLYAQEGWFSINHTAKGNNMNSIYFVNDSTGYTVSDEGYIFRTTDKGINWIHTRLSSKSLNDVFFTKKSNSTTQNIGFVVGDSGKIFKSEDGINWIMKNSNTVSNLRAVCFVDADTGYAFGDNTTILKTNNSGESWTNLAMPTGIMLTDGAFNRSGFGMCTSLDGILLMTKNYGHSWQYIDYSENVPFYAVFIADSSTAYITGWGDDVPLLLKTTDKGDEIINVTPVLEIDFSHITSSYFVNADTGYVTGEFGEISKTTDGGISWEIQHNFSSENMRSIFFLDENNGYACGDDSTIVKTTDGGNRWNLLGPNNTVEFTDIFFTGEKTGFAVGSGYLYKTTDAGADWELVDCNANGLFEYIYFQNHDTAFGVGRGFFMKTTDGGSNWDIQDLRYTQNIYKIWPIKFYNINLGMAPAYKKILKTTNGGKDWIISDANTESLDISFIDENTIISVGTYGAIYKSTDCGNTWVKKISPNGETLISSFFIDKNVGFVVGSKGKIIRTSDSGESWTQIPSNTTEWLMKIKFITNSTGYIAGENGVILYSEDAGLSWSIQKSNTKENLNTIFFTDSATGYIGGANGTMLKTVNGGIISGVEDKHITSSAYNLYQNYPNPFNPVTIIDYQIAGYCHVEIKIYDLLGRELNSPVNEYKSPGKYKISFNADNYNLPSGIYFYRMSITTNNGKTYTETKKMILLE